MTNVPYSGAYSRRRFSNYSADSKPSAGDPGGFTLSVRSGDPSMGEVAVEKLIDPSPLSSESSSLQTASDRKGYSSGAKFRARATAYKGYRFVRWDTNIDGVGNTTQNPVSFGLTKDTWLVARFEKAGDDAQKVFTANIRWDGKMGRVNGNGLVLDDKSRAGSGTISATNGNSVTLTATPLDGYRFVAWHGAPVDGKTSKEITFQMNGNYTIRAEFAAVDPGTGSGSGNVVGGGGGGSSSGNGDVEATVVSKPKESGIMAFLKKWWWAVLIAAFVIYKDKEGGLK